MKFKKFIEEKYINNKKEWILMANLSMPLSASILQKFEKEYKNLWHMTDIEGFNNLIKLQNKRKDISTFSRGSVGIAKGAKSNGTILVQLDGKSSFRSDIDFVSILDRNGKRWISQTGDIERYNTKETNRNTSIIYNQFAKVMKKKIMDFYSIDSITDLSGLISKLSGKDKSKFVSFYLDEAKKILSKSFLEKLLKQMNKMPNDSDYTNDEILLHNFVIKKVFVVDKYENYVDPKTPGYDEFDALGNEVILDSLDIVKKAGFTPKIVNRNFIKLIGN